MSEEEILNTSGEISEEAVQNVISSFRNRCTDKIRSIENIILSIQVLDSNIDITPYTDAISRLRKIDRLIVQNLSESATWKNVIMYDSNLEEFI